MKNIFKLILFIIIGISSWNTSAQILTEEERLFLTGQINEEELEARSKSQKPESVIPERRLVPHAIDQSQPTQSLLNDDEVMFFRDMFQEDALEFRFQNYQIEKKQMNCFTRLSYLLRQL